MAHTYNCELINNRHFVPQADEPRRSGPVAKSYASAHFRPGPVKATKLA